MVEITELLKRFSGGDREALDEAISAMYPDLLRLARGQLRFERPGNGPGTGTLVHELYLRLAEAKRLNIRDRTHFRALCAEMIFRMLVDQARKRKAVKRGGLFFKISLTGEEGTLEIAGPKTPDAFEIEDLQNALNRLERVSPLRSQIIKCKFFAELTNDETAEVLESTSATVRKQYSGAVAWLRKELLRKPIPKNAAQGGR